MQLKLHKWLFSSVPNVAGRRGGLMVSVPLSESSGPGLSPCRGHCVVFLGKTLNSHSASLHPGVGTGEFNAGGNPAMDWHTTESASLMGH